MDNQQAERMRVLWKSGRDKLRSFFAHLTEVRQEIGDDALPAWCMEELHIGLSVIARMTATLGAVDEELAKAEFSKAQKAEKERRSAERANQVATAEAARKDREDAARDRERERVKHGRQIAEAKVAKARAEDEREKITHNKNERMRKRADPKQRGPVATAQRRKNEVRKNLPDADLPELFKRLKKAIALCSQGTVVWVDGSIATAMVLAELRGRYSADREFGAQLEKHGIELPHQERAALIHLGRLGEKHLREILGSTDSHSYELIWRQRSRPHLKVVE